MNYKEIFIGTCIFIITQSLAWYQTNGQFISSWIKENPLITSALFGIPVGMGYIYGTTYIVSGFGGTLWASRILGFITGILTFTILTFVHVNETITLKTGVILLLMRAIVLLQIFWKN